MAARLRDVWGSYRKAALLTAAIFVVAITVAFAWAKWKPHSVFAFAPWIQLTSGAFFLSAVLGVLGSKIATWRGQSPAEKFDIRAFYVLNCVGMFLVFTSSAALLFAGR